jgi:hypothetical protein
MAGESIYILKKYEKNPRCWNKVFYSSVKSQRKLVCILAYIKKADKSEHFFTFQCSLPKIYKFVIH